MSAINGIGNAGSVQQIIALRQQILDRSGLLQELHQARESGFENGNQYGIYICLAALFAFGGALAQPRFARTAGPVVAAIVLAVTALASQSVGAIVLAGGGALALVTAARWRAGRIAAIGLVAAAALPLAAYSVGLVPVRQIAESTGIAAPAKALFEASGRGSLGWRASQNDRTAELQREGLPLGNGAWDWFAPAETRPWGLWSLMAGQYGLVPLAALALAVMCGWARRERTGRPEDATTLRMFRIGTLIVIADATLNSFIFYPLSAMMASCAPQTRRPKPAKAASGEDHPSAGSHMAGAVDGDGERQEKSWKHSGTGSRSSPSAG
ncbi:hypothetical protein J4558_02700 [Leptolyngbya sp. 15MV]|nr:hypothetical protein J4558_02700 [Leptolyngbya sp. 15MV]